MLSLLVKESGGLESLFQKGNMNVTLLSGGKNRKKRKLIHAKVTPMNHQPVNVSATLSLSGKINVESEDGTAMVQKQTSSGGNSDGPAPSPKVYLPAKQRSVEESDKIEVASVLQSMTKNEPKKEEPSVSMAQQPPPPTRNKSAFLHFSHTRHDEMKGVAGKGKKISVMWKEISSEERAKWEKIAKDDKKRYLAEKAVYKSKMKALGINIREQMSAGKTGSK
eukprot:15347131-Ditylum_brightwellii.AAC.1